jgi:hypothetical protein
LLGDRAGGSVALNVVEDFAASSRGAGGFEHSGRGFAGSFDHKDACGDGL